MIGVQSLRATVTMKYSDPEIEKGASIQVVGMFVAEWSDLSNTSCTYISIDTYHFLCIQINNR